MGRCVVTTATLPSTPSPSLLNALLSVCIQGAVDSWHLAGPDSSSVPPPPAPCKLFDTRSPQPVFFTIFPISVDVNFILPAVPAKELFPLGNFVGSTFKIY